MAMKEREGSDPKKLLANARIEVNRFAPDKTRDDRLNKFSHMIGLLRYVGGFNAEIIDFMGGLFNEIPDKVSPLDLDKAHNMLFKMANDMIRIEEIIVPKYQDTMNDSIKVREERKMKLIVPKGVVESAQAAERIMGNSPPSRMVT